VGLRRVRVLVGWCCGFELECDRFLVDRDVVDGGKVEVSAAVSIGSGSNYLLFFWV
jgi:hypothetical protein